jgi:hypothetical protein
MFSYDKSVDIGDEVFVESTLVNLNSPTEKFRLNSFIADYLYKIHQVEVDQAIIDLAVVEPLLMENYPLPPTNESIDTYYKNLSESDFVSRMQEKVLIAADYMDDRYYMRDIAECGSILLSGMSNNVSSGKAFIINLKCKDPKMMNYTNDSLYNIEGNFGDFKSTPDAILNWNNGKSYVLQGSQYWRFDNATQTFDAGYPESIEGGFGGHIGSTWNNGIDAAVQWDDHTAYYFKGDEYVGMNYSNEGTWGPKKISDGWGMKGQYASFASGIDAAINWGNGKIYLFKGNEFVRYDIATDRPDLGPLPIDNHIDRLNNWKLPVGAATNNGYKMLFEK